MPVAASAHYDGVGLYMQNSGAFSASTLFGQSGGGVTWVSAADVDGDGWSDVRVVLVVAPVHIIAA